MIMLAIYEDDNDDNYDFNDDDAVINDDYGASDNYHGDNGGDAIGVHWRSYQVPQFVQRVSGTLPRSVCFCLHAFQNDIFKTYQYTPAEVFVPF